MTETSHVPRSPLFFAPLWIFRGHCLTGKFTRFKRGAPAPLFCQGVGMCCVVLIDVCCLWSACTCTLSNTWAALWSNVRREGLTELEESGTLRCSRHLRGGWLDQFSRTALGSAGYGPRYNTHGDRCVFFCVYNTVKTHLVLVTLLDTGQFSSQFNRTWAYCCVTSGLFVILFLFSFIDYIT